jgi:glucosamine--fructose-6-phosphate aminotransferase (isomerizing)
MCGIVGYVGPLAAQDVLISGLRRLEYRGYDSSGVAIAHNGSVRISKAEGKLDRLASILEFDPIEGQSGIGHTRWATHGAPSDRNAHPHSDTSGDFVVVHNGIIENFLALREELIAAGIEFTSDTDTEVLAHLIGDEYDGDLKEAVRRAMRRAEGAYALVAMTSREPGRIVAARLISPLVVGVGEGETFIASDIPAILDYTSEILIIEDGELVDITADGAVVETFSGEPVDRAPFTVDWDPGQAEKGGFAHFMLKEIYEQPEVIENTIAGRLEGDSVNLEDVNWDDQFARDLEKIWITACGTAFNAGLVGRELFERVVKVPVEIAYAHELRYRDPLIQDNTLTLAISQSGETADTLAAARLAQEKGSRMLALTNVVGSTLSRYADDILYTRAGPEIAVASTKAYIAMLVGQCLLALKLAEQRGLLEGEAGQALASELRALPNEASWILKRSSAVAEIAQHIANVDDVYFIGRGLDFAVAMEGSLKLKEISYVHSEAMPAGELKHGTLALVTEGTPVIVVLTQEHVYDKTISALQEVKARGAHVIAVAYEDDSEIEKYTDMVLRVPRTLDLLSPVLSIIPLQLLSYYVALELGHDIDQPRNLAKSVTVE